MVVDFSTVVADSDMATSGEELGWIGSRWRLKDWAEEVPKVPPFSTKPFEWG